MSRGFWEQRYTGWDNQPVEDSGNTVVSHFLIQPALEAPTALENCSAFFPCHLRPSAISSEPVWIWCLQGSSSENLHLFLPESVLRALNQWPPAVCEWAICGVYCAGTFNGILTAAWSQYNSDRKARHRTSAWAPFLAGSPTHLMTCPEW